VIGAWNAIPLQPRACLSEGANHTCESLLILINQHFIEHGDLPPNFTVQLDNASSNKNSLVLGFLAIYVLLGIFKTARVRFLLENHAHDVYDAFQGIHAKALERAPQAATLNSKCIAEANKYFDIETVNVV